MTDHRHNMLVGVHLILRDEAGRILLIRRSNTGFADGDYCVPCGHVDANEDLKHALIREAKEEIGIIINEKDITFVGATHCQSNKESVNFFFECTQWQGSPYNAEPKKCDDLAWFSKNDLPKNMMEQSELAIRDYTTKGPGFLIEVNHTH